MQRYFIFPLLILFSIVCLFQPTIAAQDKQASSHHKAAKTVKKTSQTKQQKAKTAKKNSGKKRQTIDKATLRKSCGIVASTKRTKSAKRSQSLRKSTAKKHGGASRSHRVRKKPQLNEAETPLSTEVDDSPANIDRSISSKSFMVMNAGSGATLLARSPDAPRQPASTIKIVTAMIALKSLKNDDVVNVSHKAAGMPSSKVFLDPSRDYRANDLINAVLLASANDASVALAEKIAGSEDKFANLMTLNAKMWGAQNTVCRTASGLTAEGQHSTARDLANLFRYAMQHNEFSKRMREKKICTSYGKTLLNHNKALWRVSGAVGGKTGYTVAARQTYVGEFSRDGNTIIVAIMGSESMWADLKKLVDSGFSKMKQEQVAQARSASGAKNVAEVN